MILENSGLATDPAWKRQLTRWLLIGLGLHLLAAIFSSGFYHADEHFQILEFIHARMGKSPVSDLPIEFHRQIRPWLQPAFYGVLIRALEAIGVSDPFVWATVCRGVTSLLGWLSGAVLALCCYRWIKAPRWREVALAGFAVLWYLPALHARHSSENVGGSMFFLALGILLLGSRWKGQDFTRLESVPWGLGVFTGTLLGAAFEFRYQVGFMVLGFWLWLAWVARAPFRSLAWISVGILFSVLIGTAVDRWGYGNWTFAPWNYVNYNLIENHVHDTDSNPLWDYFRRAATETFPPLGLLALILFVIAWASEPLHALTWSALPLFVVHHGIGHKELRFLFPLIHAGSIWIVFALESITGTSDAWASRWGLRRWRWPVQAIIGLNAIALLSQSLVPAWSPIRLYQYLYRTLEGRRDSQIELHVVGEGPYHILGNPLHFYRPKALIQRASKDYAELSRQVAGGGATSLALRNGFSLPDEAGVLRELCPAGFRTLPVILDRPALQKALVNVKNWTVFECPGLR